MNSGFLGQNGHHVQELCIDDFEIHIYIYAHIYIIDMLDLYIYTHISYVHDTLAEPTIPTELLRIKNTDISAHLKLPPATWTGEMEHVPQKSSRFGRYDISLSKRA